MERTKSETKRYEWKAMQHLAKAYPKKYKLDIGIENIYLWELKDFGKDVFYWIAVDDAIDIPDDTIPTFETDL